MGWKIGLAVFAMAAIVMSGMASAAISPDFYKLSDKDQEKVRVIAQNIGAEQERCNVGSWSDRLFEGLHSCFEFYQLPIDEQNARRARAEAQYSNCGAVEPWTDRLNFATKIWLQFQASKARVQ